MVLQGLSTAAQIGRFVARASPAAFKVIDRTCDLLEQNITAGTGVAIGSELEERAPGLIAAQGIIALRAACEARKLTRRRRN